MNANSSDNSNRKSSARSTAEEEEIISINPAKRLKLRVKKEDQVAEKPYVSAAQFEAAALTLPTAEWRCWVGFARWLGCRLSEAAEDRWQDIDWENGTINRWDVKKKQRILVPIVD